MIITDVQLFQNQFGLIDLQLNTDGDLSTVNSFDTALFYSLFGEKRASASEVPTPNYRRGWIGNEGQDFENGSKLWLYEQSKITRTVLNGIRDAALNSVQWLVDDKLLNSVDAEAYIENGVVKLRVDLFRFSSPVDARYFDLWQNTGAR